MGEKTPVPMITNKQGVLNDYTLKPRNLTMYTAFRGVTDFTQVGQFSQYESGYSFLSVINMPVFMRKHPQYKSITKQLRWKLEYEFKGLEGLPDMQADTLTISDGINDLRMINKVTEDLSTTISMQYYETSGSLLTKFSEIYLSGIKDPKSQAKTYHGLIRDGQLAPGFENEVFTFMYYVTDNTMLRLEKAYLLCNCQLTKAEKSIYNGTRADIGANHEMTLEFNCTPITGAAVDRAAKVLLQDITGVYWDGNSSQMTAGSFYNLRNYEDTVDMKRPGRIAALDSTDYTYQILKPGAKPLGNPTGGLAKLREPLHSKYAVNDFNEAYSRYYENDKLRDTWGKKWSGATGSTLIDESLETDDEDSDETDNT